MKKAAGEDMIGSVWYADKEMAEAVWRKMAAACAAAGDGSGASLRQAGEGWVVEVFQPRSRSTPERGVS